MPFFHVPFQEVVLQVRGPLRVQQLLHGGFVSLGGIRFQLLACRSETGAPQQVCHQANVFGHLLASFRTCGSTRALLHPRGPRWSVCHPVCKRSPSRLPTSPFPRLSPQGTPASAPLPQPATLAFSPLRGQQKSAHGPPRYAGDCPCALSVAVARVRLDQDRLVRECGAATGQSCVGSMLHRVVSRRQAHFRTTPHGSRMAPCV